MDGWRLWHKLTFIGVMLISAIWCHDWFIAGAAITMNAVAGKSVLDNDLDEGKK